ncbi:MAG TPA: formate--tetrahydrofolate ligase, partial [Dehalococcoidia bacterium]|nr:formate--tetrahydrofolate ligase [Dehalococcoidia bacterium]
QAVVDAVPSKQPDYHPLYDLELPTRQKIEKIATDIYGASSVVFMPGARAAIRRLEAAGSGDLPICIAKTQYSLSDNPRVPGRPEGFSVTVREIRLSAGAGFIVALTGDMLTMPGLPSLPAAEGMTISADGEVRGLE